MSDEASRIADGGLSDRHARLLAAAVFGTAACTTTLLIAVPLAGVDSWTQVFYGMAPVVSVATVTATLLGSLAGPRILCAPAGTTALLWGSAVAGATCVLTFASFAMLVVVSDSGLGTAYELVLAPMFWGIALFVVCLGSPIGAAASWSARRWGRRTMPAV